MRNPSYRLGLAFLMVAATTAAIALSGDRDARAKTEYKPVSNIKNIMNALNHEEDGLYGMLRAFCVNTPARNDERWTIMRHRAALIAEGGQLLTELDPPKGDPASWKAKAEAFKEAADDLSRPLALRKGAKVTEQLEVVRKACDACHDAHRPE